MARCGARSGDWADTLTETRLGPCSVCGRLEIISPIRVDRALAGVVRLWVPADGQSALLVELCGLFADELAEGLRELRRARDLSIERSRSRYPYDGLIGQSRAMQELRLLLDKVVESDATVLIQGENGTGKDLIARSIHRYSSRAKQRYVAQNCSAFNDNLLDSELFGHKRGAFTGAVSDKQGLFEVADGGTFFLDEIGDMSPALQVKVLRVIQEGTFFPVGDTQPRRVDVRIVAATNRDLKRMVEAGTFREDLYYRVHVISLVAPPLRERRDDIPLLVEHFLGRSSEAKRRRLKSLSEACLERLMGYSWPGNVRELENEIERLLVLGEDRPLLDVDLLSARIQQSSAKGVNSERDDASLPAAVDALERTLIHETLERHHWNKTHAARELGVSRRNLIRKVQKYALEPRRLR
jgi:transcriptional regulator with PAS, ATPase and Fis domain